MDRIKKSFIISFAYVGLGTLSVLSVYPADPLYGGWSLWGLLATFPVTIISFGYRYAESRVIFPVLIIQTLMLLITWFIVYKITINRKSQS
jgi:hypothetical protein